MCHAWNVAGNMTQLWSGCPKCWESGGLVWVTGHGIPDKPLVPSGHSLASPRQWAQCSWPGPLYKVREGLRANRWAHARRGRWTQDGEDPESCLCCSLWGRRPHSPSRAAWEGKQSSSAANILGQCIVKTQGSDTIIPGTAHLSHKYSI